ncbi:hypothetical protein DFJ74DRAFT_601128 [Hyaloraphidium curvatum]|nr:hypothetical protein DFJ74DRAFT_601128 [Hyaloraphidium curvatum]
MAAETRPSSTLEAIKYQRGRLQILNQLLLPWEEVYEDVADCEEGHAAIRTMKVRGAPAIAIVGALSLAVEIWQRFYQSAEGDADGEAAESVDAPQILDYISSRLEYLKTSRPTAVNLSDAAGKLWNAVVSASRDLKPASAGDACPGGITPAGDALLKLYLAQAESMLAQDIADNRAIGRCGADYILDGSAEAAAKGVEGKRQLANAAVLTHCNTGSLATAGWGTALGVIRDLHASGKLAHCYCTETRPYNQGGRLTAYELVHEGIPATLITDSMVSWLLATRSLSAIIVGADRVAANGDTANKIGTYQLAISAKYHGVPFLVAAPTTSVDLETASGSGIVVEQRPGVEVTLIRGKTVDDEAGMKEPPPPLAGVTTCTVRIAAEGIGVWNPAFDVTPAGLITAIITERGAVAKVPGAEVFDLKAFLGRAAL